jgi:uncharacterized protein YdhG (YjbR/CyaY superfamily)
MPEQFATVEDYLASLAPEVRTRLEEVRAILHENLPGAEDTISYNMPTLVLDGRRVVHYAGWKKHVSLYPLPADEDLADELAPYTSGKGTGKFPLDRPLPRDLVARVVRRLTVESR